jgi:hypothetical protein
VFEMLKRFVRYFGQVKFFVEANHEEKSPEIHLDVNLFMIANPHIWEK